VKHLGIITSCIPKKADDTQDIVCSITHAIADMVAAKGGSAPLLGWADEKCTIPVPNPEA
jgi:hypothetical protein